MLSHFLSYGKTIAFAGADMRMLAPVQSMIEASGASIDFTFDGRVEGGRISFFTPDFMLAFPTSRAVAFVHKLIHDVTMSESLRADDHTRGISAADVGGDANLQQLRTNISPLAGPAEQDLLFDSFVPVLYDRELWERKRFVAREQLHLPTRNDLDEGRKPYTGLRALPVRTTPYGAIVTTPRLRVFLTDDRMVLEGRTRKGRPCDQCDWASANATLPLALHCNGKFVKCLDLSGCACLSREFRARVARHAATFERRRLNASARSNGIYSHA